MSLQKLKAIYNEAYYAHQSEGSERSAEALAKAKQDIAAFKANSEQEKTYTKKESSKEGESSNKGEPSKDEEPLKDEESSKRDSPSAEEEAIALNQQETKKK